MFPIYCFNVSANVLAKCNADIFCLQILGKWGTNIKIRDCLFQSKTYIEAATEKSAERPKKHFAKLWWHLKRSKGRKDAERAKRVKTCNNPPNIQKWLLLLTPTLFLKNLFRPPFGLLVKRKSYEVFFRPWAHEVSFWPKTATAAEFLHCISHFFKIK